MAITKNQKILIGVGVLALGYYLYTKNKKSTEVVVSETVVEGDGEMSNAGGRKRVAAKNRGGRGGNRAAWTKCNCIDDKGIKTGVCMSPSGSCSCCSGSDYIKGFAI